MKTNLLALEEKLSDESQEFLNTHISVNDSLSSQLQSWEMDTKLKLARNFPFSQSEMQLSEAESQFKSSPTDISEYRNDLKRFESFLREARLPRDITYWQQVTRSPKTGDKNKPVDISMQRKLLLQEWRKQLDLKRSGWELEAINRYRKRYLKQLEEWLEKLRKIINGLESLGLEPGYFLNSSKGGLSLSDIEQLKQWAGYLSKDQGVKELCELLGKVRQAALSEKIETAKTVVSTPAIIPDANSREEIIGIRLGRDIEHLLPSELSLLSDPDTATLFDLKYVESRLMCFDMQGIQSESTEVEIEEEQQVTEEDKMGPIVICVDTSGSMHGSPEIIAKAVTLYLATTARQKKRACYLINFSTGIETLDLSDGYSLKTLLSFLKKSFHGGTDVAPAIAHGLGVMEGDNYENADMLIISDFVMSSLSEDMLNAVENQRASGNRFYSLCIGNEFMSNRLKTHFDREWVYNPASASIQELISFQKGIIDR